MSSTTDQAANGHRPSHSFEGAPVETFAVSFFRNKSDATPKQQQLTIEDLAALLTKRAPRQSKDGRLFSPTLYLHDEQREAELERRREKGNHSTAAGRAKENVEALSAVVLDFDNGTQPRTITQPIEDAGYCYGFYTTHSHTPEKPKFRVVLPLSEPVKAAQWPEFWRRVAAHLGQGHADESAKDAGRIFYTPSCTPEGAAVAVEYFQPGTRLLSPGDVPATPKADPLPGPQPAAKPRQPRTGAGRTWAQAALEDECDELARAGEGSGRNSLLNRAAFRLGQIVGGGALDRATVEAELEDAAHSNGYAQKAGPEEARRAICNGLKAGEAKPRTKPENRAGSSASSWASSASTPARGADFTTLKASEIPKPELSDATGKPEYAPRQIVEMVRPDWPVAALTTHAAHAQRIRQHHGEELAYVAALGWLPYDGRQWKRDDKAASATASRVAPLSGVVRAEAAELLRHAATLAQAGRESDSSALARAARTILKHAAAVEASGFIQGALHQAAGAAVVEATQFDQRPFTLGFQNGTWAEGTWREHRRADFLLHLSPVRVDTTADHSEWLQVLARLTGGDAAFATTLQDVAAYILSGASHSRLIPWLYGPKGTGKSTFAELLQTLLGEMAVSIDPKYLQADSARERLGAAIWNKRLALVGEAGGQRLEAELLKTLSGGDSLPVRFNYGESFTARPRHVLVMVANDPPRMNAHDDALRDRVLALPFNHPLSQNLQGDEEPLALTGGPRVEAARSDPASPLVQGFTAWALEGLARFYDTQTIRRAPVVEAACARFWADADPVTPFWETVEEAELRQGVARSELRTRYERWCEDEGARPVGRDRWGKACEARGLQETKSVGVRLWRLFGVSGALGALGARFPVTSPIKNSDFSRGKVLENHAPSAPSAPKPDSEPFRDGNERKQMSPLPHAVDVGELYRQAQVLEEGSR